MSQKTAPWGGERWRAIGSGFCPKKSFRDFALEAHGHHRTRRLVRSNGNARYGPFAVQCRLLQLPNGGDTIGLLY
jgi:hypothetical protein